MSGGSFSFSEHIAAHHARCWKQLRKDLHEITAKENETGRHKARVEIKKLMALYDLLYSSLPDTDRKRELEPLLKIFKKLGKLRDHDNAIRYCAAFKIEPGIFDRQNKSLHSCRRKLKYYIDEYKAALKKIEKENAQRLPQISEEQYRDYLHSRYKRISLALHDKLNTKILHQLRRDIKQLLYNLSSVPMLSAVLAATESERLYRIESLIGDWHDTALFYDSVLATGYCGRFPETAAAIKRREQLLRRKITLAVKKKAQS